MMIVSNSNGLRAGARRLVSSIGAEIFPDFGPRILMYHRVCNSHHRLAVTPDLFRRQLDYFEQKGLEVLSVRDLISRLHEPDLNAVALSFDDGYGEMSTLVADELKSRSMGATFYVLPRFSNNPSVISPEANFPDGGCQFLDIEEIVALHKQGFEIGSHGITHRSLTNLSKEESNKEILLSKKELSSLLGEKVLGFAYPRGHYHSIHRSQVAAAGYKYGVSVRPGCLKNSFETFDLPRTEIAGGDTPDILDNKLKGGLDYWYTLVQRLKGNSVEQSRLQHD